ncbi:endonuclease [Maribellus mangrovi]|uniref:endonuclease n=1 Tax=Maribellus mangrovi TaxID=3133146 RepID=UPI0030EDD991
MKKSRIVVAVVIVFLLRYASLSCAQVPEGYYASATGLTGEQLKTALYTIIKGQTTYPYTSSSTDTWDILKESDKDTTNSDNVILIYSGWSVNAAQEYNSGNGWTREHTWAKSHGSFDTDDIGVGTDLHNLKPCDNSINSARSNKDFDNGGTQYIDGDGATDCFYDSDSWEPRDEVKGDVARILFYMATRYEGENREPDLELVDQVNTFDLNETGKGYFGKLSTLLEWHNTDPVDSFEIRRNDVIYSYQNNRNPFIDHPEYVESIWGDATSAVLINQSGFRIYPNPATDFINIDISEPAHGAIYSLSSEKIKDFEVEQRVSIQCLNPGVYLLHISSNNKVYNSKLIIQ